MLKLIALIYTVMLNGYSQWLNVRGEIFHGDIGSIDISDTCKKDATKQIKNILYLCCLYFNLTIACEIIAI